VIGAAVLIVAAVYLGFFHKWLRARIESVSPDGMYRYELAERSDKFNVDVTFALYQRASDSDWELMEAGKIPTDSAAPSNWSIDWQYDDKRRTTGIVLFGDYGSPPFEGTVVYRKSLDPGAKLRGGS